MQELKAKPVIAEDENRWGLSLGLQYIGQWKDQFDEYLEAFTIKEARATVDSCGDHGAFDAWRQLAERGFSTRPTHIHSFLKAASFPRPAVAAKELETAIALWETDIHVYESVSGVWIPMTQRKLNLEELCPEPLRKHLRG